ncbi:MAG: YabP/YqfC family sporulation protein [Eubacteriales bacterium]|nr:YabP/YqfC family sporulation protein [Lachnospiraceae bacterium]MDO5128159.1 YabP/YqfC family sporulation protein [Eubacteriales bacterium]
METVRAQGVHHFYLDERKKGSLSGIQKVESFDEELVVLVTAQGKLVLKGKDMHVTRLDVQKGELEFDGRVDSASYSELRSVKKGAAGVVKRIFG